MTSTETALVIGGGIAGPVAAMALQKGGIDAVVYEAHPTAADRVGAFLTVASNGVDALRVLGADRPVLAAGFPTPRITLRSGGGKRLGESRIGGVLPDGTTSHTIKRPTCTGPSTNRPSRVASGSSRQTPRRGRGHRRRRPCHPSPTAPSLPAT